MIIIKLLINNMDTVFEELILLLFYCRELLEYKIVVYWNLFILFINIRLIIE